MGRESTEGRGTLPATLALKVKAGLIYQNLGEAKIALYPKGEVEGKAVARTAVAPDKEEHAIGLKTTYTGHHRIEVTDRTAGTSVSWQEGAAMTIKASPGEPDACHGRWSLYFYVPKGTKIVGGYATGAGALHNGGGKLVHTFAKKPGYFSVRVGPGQDAKLWKFHQSQGMRLLMTVPPYLARNEKELLLPAEVVEKDSVGGK